MFLYALAAAAALSQSAAAQSPPTFRAGVELVRLDVRVTDADGQPITDLRQDEFEVVDGGSLPIVFFQHVQEPEGSLRRPRATQWPAESTNQGAARGQLYLILFDQLHIAPGNEQRARLAAQKFVTTRLGLAIAWHSMRFRVLGRKSLSHPTRAVWLRHSPAFTAPRSPVASVHSDR